MKGELPWNETILTVYLPSEQPPGVTSRFRHFKSPLLMFRRSSPPVAAPRLARVLPPLALAVLACVQITVRAADAPPAARIAGFRVVAFTPDPLQNEREPVNRPWSFNSPYQALYQGTHVHLLVPSPAGGFVDEEASTGKIVKAMDSLGKDLAKPRVHQVQGQEWPVQAAMTQMRIAGDGSSALVTWSVPQTPTPGAGSIGVSGEVTLSHCVKVRQVKASAVNIRQAGKSFQLGPLTLKVAEPNTFKHQGREFTFMSLETSKASPSLQRIELQNAGKTLRPLGTNPTKDRFSCDLEGLPAQVDVVAFLYEDRDKPQPLTLPFTASVGLGLTAGEEGKPPLSSVGPEEPRVTLAGFEVWDPSLLEQMPWGERKHGTSIALTLVRTAGGIMKFDPAKSRIEHVNDSKGKDLTAPRKVADTEGVTMGPGFGKPQVAEEGTSAGIILELPQPPSPGSNAIHFKASLALLCCDETVEHNATEIDLTKAGSKFKAGPYRFEVIRPEASGKADRRRPCEIKMSYPMAAADQIKQVVLKTGDRTIVAETGMRSASGDEGESDYSIPGLEKLPDSAEVVVTTYKDLKNPKAVIVPVEGTIGLGLPPQR